MSTSKLVPSEVRLGAPTSHIGLRYIERPVELMKSGGWKLKLRGYLVTSTMVAAQAAVQNNNENVSHTGAMRDDDTRSVEHHPPGA
jgi:hypothetical protein